LNSTYFALQSFHTQPGLLMTHALTLSTY
jgi:hypothetical protein